MFGWIDPARGWQPGRLRGSSLEAFAHPFRLSVHEILGDQHFFYLIGRGLMSNRLQRSFEKSWLICRRYEDRYRFHSESSASKFPLPMGRVWHFIRRDTE